MTSPFRFAHISDIHLPTLAKDCTAPGAFLNKRFFSSLSWFGNRRFIHEKAVTDIMIKAIENSAIDHILVTGDLTNLSLKGEYTRALEWLHSLGTPDTVSAIPGNHDLLLDTPASRQGLAQLSPYMGSDEKQGSTGFPFVKQRKNVLFIGLNTAMQSPLGWCNGALGKAQREALQVLLRQAKKDGLCRVVALHHPPAGHQRRKKDLEDHQAFADIIEAEGAELILHGHTHHADMHTLPGPGGPVPVMGVPSFSVRPGTKYPVSCWHEYAIGKENDDWKITLNVHRYAGPDTAPALVCKALINSV
jgi:3',5'-cyclic AMP phosphodiesterase CpdA